MDESLNKEFIKLSVEQKTIMTELLKTSKWDERNVLVGLRADFHCEYCGKDLLENVTSYKEWNIDHIIPQSKGGMDDLQKEYPER